MAVGDFGGRRVAAVPLPASSEARRAGWLAATAVLLFSAVYLPGLRTFYSNDDWAWIGYYGRISPVRFWEYFSPSVVWFYRPLQAMQFGLLFRAFGMNEVPGNVSLIVMHLGVCALAFLLLREVTGKPMLAAAMAAVFSSLGIYVQAVFWQSNFCTLQWALLTLAACVAFSRSLATRDRRWLWAAYVACGLDFFTKESAVSTPLLMCLVWLCREVTADDLQRSRLLALGRHGLALLWPAIALTLAYVVFHRLFVRDVYSSVQELDYGFTNPGQAVRQALLAINRAVLSSASDRVLLSSLPPLRDAMGLLVTDRWPVPANLLLLPASLAVIAWRTRDRTIIFGLGFFYLSFFPMVCLQHWDASRFYYLPGIGAAAIVVRVAQMALEAVRDRQGAWRSAVQIGVPIALAHLLIANVTGAMAMVQENAAISERGRELWTLVASMRGRMEPGSVLVVRNAPDRLFDNGLGVPELARLALEDPSADGAALGQNMSRERIAALQRRPNYQVDFNERPLRIVRIGARPPSASASHRPIPASPPARAANRR